MGKNYKKSDDNGAKPLVRVDENGIPDKYDKYGNLVKATTGAGKGIMLKQQYNTPSKNLAAPSPMEVVRGLTRPYWSIAQMPLEYVYNSILEYFNNILEPVYKRLPLLDDNGNPTYTIDGTAIEQTVLVNYNYKNVPTKYGLAQALGIDYHRLCDYINNNNSNDDGKETTFIAKNNKDLELIDVDNITTSDTLYKIYNDDVYYNSSLREELRRKTYKEIKRSILKRAFLEVMKYHEQRLGLNENVTGSLFALLNSKDGWTNDHTVKVEFPDLLGKQRTVEELDKMIDYEDITPQVGGGTIPLPAKDFDFDEKD